MDTRTQPTISDAEHHAAVTLNTMTATILALAPQYDTQELYSDAMAADATDTLKMVTARIKDVEAERSAIVSPLNESIRRINTLFSTYTDRLKTFKNILADRLTKYTMAKEAAARVERERAAVEAAQETQNIRLEIQRQASVAQAAGDNDTAAALMVSAQSVVIPAPLHTDKVKLQGVTTRKRWVAEVYDHDAFFVGIASGVIPTSAAQPVQSIVDQAARSANGKLNWPGVRCTMVTTTHATGR